MSPGLHAEHQTLHKKPYYTSSAQITTQHTITELEGASVLTVINFPRKQIGPKMSDCLVTGVLPLGVEPDVKRAHTVFVRPWMPEGVEGGVEPGARVGVLAKDDSLLYTNLRDLTWDEFTQINILVGTVIAVEKEILKLADGSQRQLQLKVDFGDVVGQMTSLIWLRTTSFDIDQLIGRQILAITNITADAGSETAELFNDSNNIAVLTVSGRATLEPAKVVPNGYCLA